MKMKREEDILMLMQKELGRVIPLSQWDEFHPWPSVAALRHMVRKNPKGFDKVIRRMGSRILILEKPFLQWVVDELK